ncbi:MAG: tRNA (guanosine(37)-N1)-methyltransferase TrmD [Spirochaetes bacterium]|nr:tRNA (guanosine(37)-N1)-methyltransferase TrmD [Spirochaetota bacterium]
MNFYLLTLFPELLKSFSATSIIKKGIDKKLFSIIIKDIRENAINKYGQVDDEPYGGGSGMVLRPEPIYDTFKSLKLEKKKLKTIYFSPKGRKIDNNYIINLTNFKNIVLICGHYEGIDQRIIDLLVDEEVSLGDFILTGGEIPAMALIDAVIRHIKGVIKPGSLKEESFTNNLLEYKQYTRPEVFRNMKVPEVLLSGNHKKISEYRLKDSVKETLLKRPDLLEKEIFDNKIIKLINEIREDL